MEPTCVDGIDEYWECSECHALYSDAKGKNEPENSIWLWPGHIEVDNGFVPRSSALLKY